MYKVFTHLVAPLFCYLPVYMLNLLLIEWVTKMKPGTNSVEEPSLLGVGGVGFLLFSLCSHKFSNSQVPNVFITYFG